MARGKQRKTKRKRAQTGRFSALAASFLVGKPLDERTSARVRELGGLLLIGVATWLLVSMASYYTPLDDPEAAGRNWGGAVGYWLADGSFRFTGLSGYLLAFLGICWGAIVVAGQRVELPFIRSLGAACFVLSISFLLDLGFGAAIEGRRGPEGLRILSNELPYGPGGWLAYVSMEPLVRKFGGPGLWVLLLTSAGISFLLATEMAFYPSLKAFGAWMGERRERWGEQLGTALWGWFRRLMVGLWDFVRGADLAVATAPADAAPAKRPARRAAATGKTAAPELFEDEEEEFEDEDEYEEEDADADEYEDEEDDDEEEEDEDEDEEEEEEEYEDEDETVIVPTAPSRTKAKPRQRTMAAPVYEPPTPPPGPWTLPPLDLLEPPAAGADLDQEFLEESANKLEHALKSFRVEAEVVGAQVGPAVTLFELTVAQGTRMNKVTQLSQEIAATLRAQSVRIIAPIPGKSTIGIEVPNAQRRTVRISELITQKAYDKKLMALPFFLGMDAEGNAIVEDLARMPHLLIAGTTGSGKSVCINTILASILLTRSPHDVRLILVDPKMVELQVFARVPHLELPVVSDMRQATQVMLWAVEKMEGRYELFKNAGVKNIKSYNALGEDELRKRLGEDFHEDRTPRHVPYIVIVIDEMADLMMTSKKEAEQAITRLAQKSRAVGVHVILATQRPSTDVITGVIKGNLPSRIAFQVASKIDSRVILDVMGAEKLLGQGDMLYSPPQSSVIRRVQGALVEDHELEALVDFVCTESVQTFNQELVQTTTGTAGAGTPVEQGMAQDDMFDEAVRVILKTRRGSASLLQRALGIGYTRASRLIDMMTDAGIVGEHKGSKAREILMDLADWEEMNPSPAEQGVNDG